MESGSCRSINANQELHTTQKMYETCTTARNKRKIADLEASAKEEAAQRTEEVIAEEVDWIVDPGTPSKRATQFVRTQAESWKIKTLLARALDAKESQMQHSSQENLGSKDILFHLHEIHKSLDLKISTVHDKAKTVNKKLTLLIRLLRRILSLDPPLQSGQQQAQSKEAQNYKSLQDRVDKHVIEVGLDTLS